MAFQLSQQQGNAVKKIKDWFKNSSAIKRVFVLAGFAGTGKSTILPDILNDLGISVGEVAFCAPTGKAAKVMGEKLRAQGIKAYPTTIHSLIYTPKPQKAEFLERELAGLQEHYVNVKAGNAALGEFSSLRELEKKIDIITKDLDRAYTITDLHFNLNPDSKLVSENKKLIIVDEASMCGKQMAGDLLDFDIPVLAIGDPGQLPPVGDEPGFLDDSPDFFLTEVHRQAAENPIIHLATLVRKGERGDYGDYGGGVMIVRPKDDRFSLDLDRDAQIIVGTNRNRWRLTSRIRKTGGYLDTAPMTGEPLIMCKNSKQYPDLVNGTQIYSADDHGMMDDGAARYLLKAYDEEGNLKPMYVVQALFEQHIKRDPTYATASKSAVYQAKLKDNHVDFGWAITCHKSQGSQWDEVIVHDESHVFRESADQWLYTAITRAAERLIIVAPD
ncbi:ATP-dependent RecD-like DNA helicase [Sphingobium phage Lacusarx]|uniref:ATP-dependent RecD-like DNA helicase n=1 Tax=Sphingobium phage Lacusarx TaxID=1980139 RepID=A0A1W6DX18_9CAUD|nr:Dda-like helicase [Sphingobium phage Lacusarx]ARK07445.1 ATP-dependent RecD-like DNA helicase [Sphingobium phage Lacusarx]